MAIGPSELKRNLEAEAKGFEASIDTSLSKAKLYSSTFSVVPPDGMFYAHFQILQPLYLKAGWKRVTWKDHQIDGKEIEFSTIETPTNGDWRDR